MANSPSAWFAGLTEKQKRMVLAQVTKEASRRFEHYMSALLEATGLSELRGQDLLDALRSRTPDQWATLSEQFPQDAEKQLREMGRLERRAALRLDELVEAPTVGLGALKTAIATLPTPRV